MGKFKVLISSFWTVLSLFLAPPLWAKCPRVIALSPALTELQYQLGQGNCLVGASEYSDYPVQAKQLPRVGGLFSPNIEKILLARPDWVLVDFFTTNPSIEEALEASGIKSIKIKIQSVAELFSESKKILKTVYEVEPFAIIAPFEKRWVELQRKKIQGTFLFLTWLEPAIAATTQTFFSDLITQLGGRPLLSQQVIMAYPTLSKEWLVLNPPENLFLLLQEDKKNTEEIARFLASNQWKKSPKMFILPDTYFSRTTFSALQGLEGLKGI